MCLIKIPSSLSEKNNARESVKSSIDSHVVKKPCSDVVLHYLNVSRCNSSKSSTFTDNVTTVSSNSKTVESSSNWVRVLGGLLP